jgi:hypothetical protein
VDFRIPFFAQSGSRPPSRTNDANVRDHENARSKRPEQLEMKTKATTHEPGRTGAVDAARGLLQGGKGRRKKKRPWGSA